MYNLLIDTPACVYFGLLMLFSCGVLMPGPGTLNSALKVLKLTHLALDSKMNPRVLAFLHLSKIRLPVTPVVTPKATHRHRSQYLTGIPTQLRTPTRPRQPLAQAEGNLGKKARAPSLSRLG